MSAFREPDGKWSSKRTIGLVGASICLIIFGALFFWKAAQISDTLLLGMFTASVALLATTVFKKG